MRLTRPRLGAVVTTLLMAAISASGALLSPAPSLAASSAGCAGGGFSLLGLSGDQNTVVPASSLGGSFLVKGKYIEFTVDSASFGVRNWTLTGAPNPLDITGGVRTAVFASKIPDHRGLTLTSGVAVKSSGESLVISRTGLGLSMKIQVQDCANGGVFQMEPARADGTATTFTHVLADGVFYFDNPNVRDRLGERLPCSGILPDGTPAVCPGANPDGTVTVAARVNFANNSSDKFVGRDSPQAATRITVDCTNNIPNPFHPGTVSHCGGVSQWSVASGGRLGQVMGEDATEIAPAAKLCTSNCTAQDRVQGKAVVVGFPFPVPDPVRLKPRVFAGFVPVAKVNVDKLSGTLNARQEVPAQKLRVSGATGKFTGTIVGRRLTWKLTFRSTSGPVLAAHIHLAKAGKADPVPAVPLCAPCRSGATGRVTVTNKVERAIKAGGAYVNIHTAKNQAGEIRGQIKVIES